MNGIGGELKKGGEGGEVENELGREWERESISLAFFCYSNGFGWKKKRKKSW